MSKFETYLINEARAKVLTQDQAERLIRKNCKWAVKAFKKGHEIYRGTESPMNTGIGYVDPRKFERKSANTENFYTLIMSNHKSWKHYPVRKHSMICSTDPNTAAAYGNDYIVLPYDGANIGVCPYQDIWVSFGKTFGESLDGVNSELRDLFNILKIEWDDTDWSKFKKALKEFSMIYTRMYKLGLLDWSGELEDLNSFTKEFVKHKKEFNFSAAAAWEFVKITQGQWYAFRKFPVERVDFDKWFFNMMNPVTNKFKVAKIGMPLPKGDRELWIADPCILLKARIFVDWIVGFDT